MRKPFTKSTPEQCLNCPKKITNPRWIKTKFCSRKCWNDFYFKIFKKKQNKWNDFAPLAYHVRGLNWR